MHMNVYMCSYICIYISMRGTQCDIAGHAVQYQCIGPVTTSAITLEEILSAQYLYINQ